MKMNKGLTIHLKSGTAFILMLERACQENAVKASITSKIEAGNVTHNIRLTGERENITSVQVTIMHQSDLLDGQYE